jgi:hypothetical protein
MDKTPLVSVDLKRATAAVQALDAAKVRVNVAAFLQLSEYVDPRLVLASRTFDSMDRGKAYGLVHQAMRAKGIPVEHEPTLLILSMKDPTIRDLRRIFGKSRTVEGMRLGLQTFGDRFVEDGYVYRIT